MTKNILILCHGMTLAKEIKSHRDLYDGFTKRIFNQRPGLRAKLEKPCYIEYGHQTEKKDIALLKKHEKLLDAENFIEERIAHKAVKKELSSANISSTFPANLISGGNKSVMRFIRNDLFTHGFTDALYYASSDGEKAIRNTIYTQVLKKLQKVETDDDVRLHVVAHSLGSTVMFDFLYGLFAPDECLIDDEDSQSTIQDCEPDFYKDNINTDLSDYAIQYKEWRAKTKSDKSPVRLKLASFSTFGGQLPFFFMRKQSLVDKFASSDHESRLLDAGVIGVPDRGLPVWKVFYDVNDLLGYPVKRLFQPTSAIQEFHINTTWKFWKAHEAYWDNERVIREIAKIIERTSRS